MGFEFSGLRVKKKTDNENDWLRRSLDLIEKRKQESPIIETKYYVVEITPSKRYSYDNGHGQAEWDWTRATSKAVSGEFAKKEYAE